MQQMLRTTLVAMALFASQLNKCLKKLEFWAFKSVGSTTAFSGNKITTLGSRKKR